MKCGRKLHRAAGFISIKSSIFLALACEHRLRIVELLENGERTTQYINNHMNIHPSVVSRHLNLLLSAGLVNVRREGVNAHWRLASERVKEIVRISNEIAKDIVKTRKKLYESMEGES